MVSRENDTYFENGLVIGYADSKCYAGLVEILKSNFIRKPGPLSDTLQPCACIFQCCGQLENDTYFENGHVASLQFLPTSQYGHLLGAISWSP